MPVRARSNPLALAVLTCLYEKPMHPYEVAQTLRARATHESIRLNYGSLYSVVESLEKRGLVRSRGTIRTGRRPERTVYEITDEGGHELADWLSALLAIPEKEYLQFEAALTLAGALPPAEVVSLLGQRIQGLEGRLSMLKAGLRGASEMGVPQMFLIEAEYQQALLAAELDFVGRLVKEIEGGSLEGVDEWRRWHSSKRKVPKKRAVSPRRVRPKKGKP